METQNQVSVLIVFHYRSETLWISSGFFTPSDIYDWVFFYMIPEAACVNI